MVTRKGVEKVVRLRVGGRGKVSRVVVVAGGIDDVEVCEDEEDEGVDEVGIEVEDVGMGVNE